MKISLPKIVVVPMLLLSFTTAVQAKQLAFPTAEGFGKYTVGGRGGHVYEVTNLKDSGPGSLREALASPGPRTIVFRVSGNIELNSAINVKSHTTIAGQTAPGDGICIKGWPLNFSGTQIIIRYIRVRLGDGTGGAHDAIHGSGNGSDMILDHISASWSVDETFSIYGSKSVTIQWCMITESLNQSNHDKGTHGFGGLWGGLQNSHHHNLFAHHTSRNPRFKGNSDYRNNVVYNWGNNSAYGGGPGNGLEFNMVNNYYKPGPATPKGQLQYRIVNPYGGEWYIDGNFVFGNPTVTANNWDGGIQDSRGSKVNMPFPFEPINQQSAEKAFEIVLENVGCNFPKRDALDSRIIQEVREGKTTYGTNGIIDSPKDVGGWPELTSTAAPTDSDHDGMPDSWEISNGLDQNDPKDGNKIGIDGYTYLENYMNGLVDKKTTSLTEVIVHNNPHLSFKVFNTSYLTPMVEFSLPVKSEVTLEVFTANGIRKSVLIQGEKSAGKYNVDFSKTNLTSGQYIVKLTTAHSSRAKSIFISK